MTAGECAPSIECVSPSLSLSVPAAEHRHWGDLVVAAAPSRCPAMEGEREEREREKGRGKEGGREEREM